MSFAAFDTTTWYHMRYHTVSEHPTSMADNKLELVVTVEVDKANQSINQERGSTA